MTNTEKQQQYAQCLYVRGLITEDQMKRVIGAKFSYDLIETMLDFASAQSLLRQDSARNMLMRMTK